MKKLLSLLISVIFILSNLASVFAEPLSSETQKALDAKFAEIITYSTTNYSDIKDQITYFEERISKAEEKKWKYSDGTAAYVSYEYIINKIKAKVTELKNQQISNNKPNDTANSWTAVNTWSTTNIKTTVDKVISDSNITYKEASKNICSSYTVWSSLLKKDSNNIANILFKEIKKWDNSFYSKNTPTKLWSDYYFLVSTVEYNKPRFNVIKLLCSDYTFSTISKIDFTNKDFDYLSVGNTDTKIYFKISDKWIGNYEFDSTTSKVAKIKEFPNSIGSNSSSDSSWKINETTSIVTNSWTITSVNSLFSAVLTSLKTNKLSSMYQIQWVINDNIKIDYVEVLTCDSNYSEKYDKERFRLKLFKKWDKTFNINVAEKFSNLCKIPYKIRIIQGSDIFETSYKLEF